MNIEQLHDSPWRGVFYVTGGGSLLLSNLLSVPGASKTVLDARVPYAESALADLLGSEPEQACSSLASRMLAMKAYSNAGELDDSPHLFGLGVTASLATNRVKRGRLRAFVALQTADKSQVTEIRFSKDQARESQESEVADVALQKLGIGLGITSGALDPESDRESVASTGVQALLHDEPHHIGEPGSIFLPGAFNPLHSGHMRMKELAEEICGKGCQYELCVRNFDKPHLDFVELEQRRSQLPAEEHVVTNVPRFSDKAQLLVPDGPATFVVGADTVTRIADPSYYRSLREMRASIRVMEKRGDKFLVFGRLGGELEFVTLDDVVLPQELRRLCSGFSEEQFRMDISSTEIRQRAHSN